MARTLPSAKTALGALTLLGAGGCAATDGHPVGTTPHTFESSTRHEGELLPLPELERELAASLSLIRDIDPALVAEGFARQADQFDDSGCPSLTVHNGQDLWIDDCTTETGMAYHGHYLSLHWYDVPVEREWYRRFLWNSGQANVTAPDGARFLAMGDAWLGDYDDSDGVATVSTFLHGDFLWDAEPAEDTWIEELYYVYFNVEAQTFVDNSREVWLDGDVARLPTRIHAVTMQDIRMRRGPGACSAEPEGTMRFRDEVARQWYVLEFDGHDSDGLATASCDGCGSLSTLDGEPLGGLCPDMQSWLEWEAWPW